jgi:hypothetical protein
MAGAAIAGMVRHTPARASALPARPASAQAVRGGDCIAGDLGERAWRVERRVDPTPRGGRVRTRGDVEPARRAGLLVPTGVVLTRRAHEAFLQASGASRDIQDAAGGEGNVRRRAMQVRLGYASGPLEETLNQEICEALIGLRARAVVVLSEDLEERGLGCISNPRGESHASAMASRTSGMLPEAVARGEYLPTWPVLVQRELSPRFTGWSTIGEAAIFGGDSAGTPADARTALYDIEPVGEEAVGGKGIAELHPGGESGARGARDAPVGPGGRPVVLALDQLGAAMSSGPRTPRRERVREGRSRVVTGARGGG